MFEKGVNTRFKQPDNNLLVKFPIIAMEFDSEKNGITPDKVYPNSNKKSGGNVLKDMNIKPVLHTEQKRELVVGNVIMKEEENLLFQIIKIN